MDTSTWGLLIALVGGALVLSSDYLNSMLPLFIGLVVAWLGINTIIRGRRDEYEKHKD